MKSTKFKLARAISIGIITCLASILLLLPTWLISSTLMDEASHPGVGFILSFVIIIVAISTSIIALGCSLLYRSISKTYQIKPWGLIASLGLLLAFVLDFITVNQLWWIAPPICLAIPTIIIYTLWPQSSKN